MALGDTAAVTAGIPSTVNAAIAHPVDGVDDFLAQMLSVS
jgi:hypothetical protein